MHPGKTNYIKKLEPYKNLVIKWTFIWNNASLLQGKNFKKEDFLTVASYTSLGRVR